MSEPEARRSGLQRITIAFQKAQKANRAALMPYLTLGYPSPAASLVLVEKVASAGADLLELGVPFSDPLADGPTIQQATHVALQQGMSVQRCLEMCSRLRERGLETPFLLMGYYNPILTFGEDAFCRACREVGVDGLIVPDLPPEEGESLERISQEHGLALVYLLAPTSPPERIDLVAGHSQGFIYLVSLTGVTGARESLQSGLANFINLVRQRTDKPLAVGFGISTPQQAAQVASLADGVIIGSALVKMAGQAPMAHLKEFMAALRQAVER
ncbi:MAG: tryptophan synthase subunit alpha [Anaerolineae bacterium]